MKIQLLLIALMGLSGATVAAPRKKQKTPIAATGVTDESKAKDEQNGVAPPLITSEIGGRDLRFLTEALDHGKAQLHLTELALAKGESEQIKALSETLATTQAEENKKLIRLGALKGVGLSPAESTWSKMLDTKLAGLSGPKFDKSCLEQFVQINERAVATYEAAVETRDTDIKAFVEQGLPLAKEKLQFANRMSGVGKPQAAAVVEAK